MTRVTLYSKPDCHLCDIVKDVISAVHKRRAFELEIRNILNDPGDFERFKTEIPVIFVNDQEIARYRLSEARLDFALDQAGPG